MNGNLDEIDVRSRPLSEELTEAYREGYGDGRDATITELGEVEFVAKKAERERINNELDYIKHTESLQDFFVTVHLCDVRKIVRGEP